MNLWLSRRSRTGGRIKVVRDVDVVSGVGVGQRGEGVDVLDGAEGSLIEGVVAAALGDLDVGDGAVTLDLEGDVDAMAGGLGIEHAGIPLRGYLLGDLLDVVGEAGAEGGVGGGGGEGAGTGLGAAHGNVGGGFSGLRLV